MGDNTYNKNYINKYSLNCYSEICIYKYVNTSIHSHDNFVWLFAYYINDLLYVKY